MRRRPILVPSELALAFLSPCVEIRHFGVGRSLAVNCGIVPLRQCVWGNAAQTRSRAEKRDTDEATLERERASGNKLWSVYIYEAQKYDQGLIEGWRSEMDGLLIFAGLFSGVVTTFIIDSYKTLNPDSGSQTVVLLSQTVALLSEISSQLASMNNATAVADALPPPAAFSPPVSSLVCNALWFASLGLSLSSALVATLVKQWAQEYQHRTSMFSSPSVRSRVYMYLYYGLRRFNMHAVVGVPPLLLHGALLLFFAGLVAFLVPINIFIMAIISALLLLFILVYGTFTALPLFFFNSPYQTPLTRILWSLNQSFRSVLRAYVRNRAPQTDSEALAGSPVPGDTRPQNQSMVDALKWAALHRPREAAVKTETRAVAWTMRALSDDLEFGPFVESLAETLWDFDIAKPRSVYQAHFENLLRDPQVHLCQRLADFMAGSNSNLLDPKERVRRQLSVLRAIWAICAFSLHIGSPLRSPIGDADVDNALLGSKFCHSDEVQSMLPDVSALIRLNTIESQSREHAPTEKSNSDGDIRAEAKKRRQADMHRTYAQYLVALSKCAASFQRDVTNSLFHQSQMLFKVADGYINLHWSLQLVIRSASDETADNLVSAARQIITPFAQTSDYPWWLNLFGLGPFLVRHPSLIASDPKSDLQPASKYHYTRYLCHTLCENLEQRLDLPESVDALQLIYRHLLQSDEPPRDLVTHLLVLRTLQNETADIRTHRLVAIVQFVVLRCFLLDSSELGDMSEWEKLPSIFDDKDWFRAVIGLDNEKRTERALARQIYDCAHVGVLTTFIEHCTTGTWSPDQIEQDLNLETFKLIPYAFTHISSMIPTELQHRFADAASAFIRKYPKDCLVGVDDLYSVLHWAVKEDVGWITDVDALQVLDAAVSEVQTDNQQESHQRHAEWIRVQMQKRLLLPEIIFAALISLMSDGE